MTNADPPTRDTIRRGAALALAASPDPRPHTPRTPDTPRHQAPPMARPVWHHPYHRPIHPAGHLARRRQRRQRCRHRCRRHRPPRRRNRPIHPAAHAATKTRTASAPQSPGRSHGVRTTGSRVTIDHRPRESAARRPAGSTITGRGEPGEAPPTRRGRPDRVGRRPVDSTTAAGPGPVRQMGTWEKPHREGGPG